MKLPYLLTCALAAATLLACGDGGSQDESDGTVAYVGPSSTPRQVFEELNATRGEGEAPHLAPRTEAVPKGVVVKDFRIGHGPPIKPRQEFLVNYIAFEYRTGKERETHWGPTAFRWMWRVGGIREGWEIGLAGMKTGGRRQLIVPSKLAYGDGDLVYLIELLSLGKRQAPVSG